MRLLLLGKPRDKSLPDRMECEFFGPWAQPCATPEGLRPPRFEPYPDAESVYRANLRAMANAHALLAQLAKLMPAATGLDLGERFWRLYLSDFVILITSIVEDILARRAALPEADYILGLPEGIPRSWGSTPRTWGEAYARLFYDPVLRYTAFSLLLAPSYKEARPVRYEIFYPRRASSFYGELRCRLVCEDKSTLLRKAVRKVLRLPPRSKSLCAASPSLVWDRYNMEDFEFSQLNAQVLPPLPSDPRAPGTLKPDVEKRGAVARALPAPYGELLVGVLPLAGLEGLAHTYSRMQPLAAAYDDVERVYTHGQGFSDEDPRRTLLALLGEKGKRIHMVQHGGGSMSFRTTCQFFTERQIADGYISWGGGYCVPLSIPNANPARSLPSIYLSLLQKQAAVAAKTRWKVLLVVFEESPFLKYYYSMVFPDMAHDYFSRQKRLCDRFLNSSSNAIKAHRMAYGWGQAAWIRSRYPKAKLLTSGRFVQYAMQSELVIIDYNSSPLPEMLAMNRPFLVTWNRRWFGGSEVFERHLDGLKNVQIFHEGPGSLMQTFDDIQASGGASAWWGQADRQRVVQATAREFALASPNFSGSWTDEFSRRSAGPDCP